MKEKRPDLPPREAGENCNARRKDGSGYCRKSAGWGTSRSSGRCRLHGGSSPRGPAHPSFKHGLFSDHLDEEDQETMELLKEYGSAEKLEELINWRLARLRRAVKHLNQGEREERSFWDAFEILVNEAAESPDGIGTNEIRELGNLMSAGQNALQSEVDLVRRLIKTHHKISEGDKLSVDHSGSGAGGAFEVSIVHHRARESGEEEGSG